MTARYLQWIGVLAAGSAVAVCLAAQTTHGDGKALFEGRCGGCHALDRDLEGPRLRGVYGRVAGSVRSFDYSDALKNSNITWDYSSLEKWLTNPEGLVPGNNMAFRLEKAAERRGIVDYLKSNSAW